MARPFRTLSTVNITPPSSPTTFLFFVVAVFAVGSMLSFLCTSRKLARRQTHREGAEPRPSDDRKFVSTIGNIGGKAQLMAMMISWRKEGKEGDESDEAVWRKTILLGDRCRPLDFSGRILYDSEGNPLLEQPNRTPGRDPVSAINAPTARGP
ncbi:hypothetical protein H6P81_010084 [Aristolochia fimbriata]|uniref:Transmembrane protein n=1 Tax=Aristolochia fimbriata TaxID=158543 RepID=A0AAV7ENN1_ARIFI|nr:hypothetical protein H6P81_010084 [Aristolochia fimbriata]